MKSSEVIKLNEKETKKCYTGKRHTSLIIFLESFYKGLVEEGNIFFIGFQEKTHAI